jgi:predicted RNA-binding protein with PIN domain
MDIIIDGYNLIGIDQGLNGPLEHKRNWLIQQLSRYQRIKGFNITVVFDGWQAGRANEAVEKTADVSVIYSKLGEKADAVITRLTREKSSGAVVVTSDREIRSAAERAGAVAVSAGEFNKILRALDGIDANDANDWNARRHKHGNPNRLSKSERRRSEKLKKLRL